MSSQDKIWESLLGFLNGLGTNYYDEEKANILCTMTRNLRTIHKDTLIIFIQRYLTYSWIIFISLINCHAERRVINDFFNIVINHGHEDLLGVIIEKLIKKEMFRTIVTLINKLTIRKHLSQILNVFFALKRHNFPKNSIKIIKRMIENSDKFLLNKILESIKSVDVKKIIEVSFEYPDITEKIINLSNEKSLHNIMFLNNDIANEVINKMNCLSSDLSLGLFKLFIFSLKYKKENYIKNILTILYNKNKSSWYKILDVDKYSTLISHINAYDVEDLAKKLNGESLEFFFVCFEDKFSTELTEKTIITQLAYF